MSDWPDADENPFDTAEIVSEPPESPKIIKPKPKLPAVVPEAPPAEPTSKLEKVVQEIIQTEESYLLDISAVNSIYAGPSCPFKPAEAHLIFTNLPEVAQFSHDFLGLLRASRSSDSAASMLPISQVFRSMMRRMDDVYSTYCKRHEDSIARIVELQADPTLLPYWKACQAELKKVTNSPPDLGSMLLKPVQRILKYPLLLREIQKQGEKEGAVDISLGQAIHEMNIVANHINEVKRRKDMVEKIVTGKGHKSLQHGINKTWHRGTQQLKQAAGFASNITTDLFYAELEEKMNAYDSLVNRLLRMVGEWMDACRLYTVAEEQLSGAWSQMLNLEDTKIVPDFEARVKRIERWRRLSKDFSDINASVKASQCFTSFGDLSTTLANSIQPDLEVLIALYAGPRSVMKKRDKKLLDHDRLLETNAQVDKADVDVEGLSKFSSEYAVLNSQLIDELPLFLGLVDKYVAAVVTRFVSIVQCDGWWLGIASKHHQVLAEFDSQFSQPVKSTLSVTRAFNIINEYRNAERKLNVEERIRSIPFLVPVTAKEPSLSSWFGSPRRQSLALTPEVTVTRPRSASHSNLQNYNATYQPRLKSKSTTTLDPSFLIDISEPVPVKSSASKSRETLSHSQSGPMQDLMQLSNTSLTSATTDNNPKIPPMTISVSSLQADIDAFIGADDGALPPRNMTRSTSSIELSATGTLKLRHLNMPIHLERILFECVSIYPYKATCPEEMDLPVGLKLHVLEQKFYVDATWVFCRNSRTGEKRWVPMSHLTRI